MHDILKGMNKMKKRKLTPIGKLIVKRLIDLNKTQIELCEEVGVHKVYFNYIIHGERSGQKYMPEILRALGLQDEHQSA